MSLTGKPDLTKDEPIKNDGFWPDLMIGDLMDNYQIDSEIKNGTIRTGLTMAVIRVNDQLNAIKTAMIDLGNTSLSEYSADNVQLIADQDVLLTQYHHAVFSRAKAGLLIFKSQPLKTADQPEHSEKMQTEQYWLDESQGCIKAFFDLILPTNTTMSKANAHVIML